MQTLLNLFPDKEFEASNNEEEDVSERTDESYSQAIKNMKYNYVGLFPFWFNQKLLRFLEAFFSIFLVIWKQFLMLPDKSLFQSSLKITFFIFVWF